MILRSLTAHVKDQNWFAVWVDFAIVVIGVFIGIQVSNWNERQADKRIGEEYVARILLELDITEETFQRNLDFSEWVIDYTLRALDLLEFESGDLDAEFVVASFIAAHEIVGYIKRDVYDELLSVGSLNKIANLEVRERIQNFYQIEQDLFDMGTTENTYQFDLRGALPHDVIMILRKSCSARYTDKLGTISRLPRTQEDCMSALSSEQLSRALANLEAADIRRSLRQAFGDYQNKQRDFMDVLEKVRELKGFLKGQLAPLPS
ncbi:hypothetical protein [Congregibacter litoralis]|uniref:Uncharacterized protein n=1 Tax=Congregibacter litoralis KT71 TaxID=314285 RepID=A4AC89_9GAMM|nr:hypothetical protein [Congregibacter litoralis]EAQ96317.1 hypothetical protein KT71_13060 [Congregibacter litoralis KT71]